MQTAVFDRSRINEHNKMMQELYDLVSKNWDTQSIVAQPLFYPVGFLGKSNCRQWGNIIDIEHIQKDFFNYVISEMVTSEHKGDGLYQVEISIRLNERRLVHDVNQLMSKKSGDAIKPRVMILLNDETSNRFSNAIAEEFNARGLFDIKDKKTLQKIVDKKIQKKMDTGTLTQADIEAIQGKDMVQRGLDFIIAGDVKAMSRRGSNPISTVSVIGLRVIDMCTAQVVATTTDSFEAEGIDANTAITNAAVKAAKVLAPRVIEQLVSRWNDMLQASVTIKGITWFSKKGRDFYGRVLMRLKGRRGRIIRRKGPGPGEVTARFAFQGDLYGFVDQLEAAVKKAGMTQIKVSGVDEDNSVVHLVY